MCGLIGALLAEPSLTDERIAGALVTIAHRGPDHTGWWCSSDRRTVLGHVRLSIIGLDNGDQPLVSAGGEVRCVVNGELYGYRAGTPTTPAASHSPPTDARTPTSPPGFGKRSTMRLRSGSSPAFSTLAVKMYPFFTDAYLEAGLRADPYTELLDTLDVHRRLRRP